MSGPHAWSTNPANNGTIDSRAQFPQGMNANAVDGAARGLMASVALARDDNLGVLVATLGANNVYTVTTGQGLIDPASTAGGGTGKISHPFSLRVVLPAMNTAVATTAPTIIIDGAAAVPLTRRDGSALADGDIIGVPVEILGDAVTSGAYSRARILDLLQSDIAALAPAQTAFPIGGILPFTGSNIPTGFLIANGATVSRTTYASLWAHAQASNNLTDDGNWQGNSGFYQGYYSQGDGSTTFRLPHLGGVFLRGLDQGRGFDPSRNRATLQYDALRSHGHSLNGGGFPVSVYGSNPNLPLKNDPGGDTSSGFHAATIANTGDSETRPVNVAYPFLIRAY